MRVWESVEAADIDWIFKIFGLDGNRSWKLEE